MELRRFRPLFEAGVVTIAEVARASGRDWRTVKKYLTAEASSAPAAPRAGGSGDQPGPRRTCTAVTCATFPQAVHAPSGPVGTAAHPHAAAAAITAAMTPGTVAARMSL